MATKPRDKYKVATYNLASVQAQMQTIEDMNLTNSATQGIYAAGMTLTDALQVVQNLEPNDIYKTMACDSNWNIWQDVYHADWNGKPLYVKFQMATQYFVISFKDL